MKSLSRCFGVLLLLAALVPALGLAATTMVNINEATAKEISASLTGIGLKKAEAIVAYRQANGKFKQVKDLLKVKGIGPKILLKNENTISVNGAGLASGKGGNKAGK